MSNSPLCIICTAKNADNPDSPIRLGERKIKLRDSRDGKIYDSSLCDEHKDIVPQNQTLVELEVMPDLQNYLNYINKFNNQPKF